MNDQEKQAIVAKSIDTRRGRNNLAWTMTQPISPGMRHPCAGCGHENTPGMCENIVHNKVGDQRTNCWYPAGCLAVADERRGGRFRFPMIDKKPISDVVTEEDQKIFDAIALLTCPEGCLMAFDERKGRCLTE
jgi:hypothetical protein